MSETNKRALTRASKFSYWQGVLEDWKRSNLSVKLYCHQHTLSKSTFRYWQYKRSAAKGRAKVVIQEDKGLVFQEVKIEGKPGLCDSIRGHEAIELLHPTGVKVSVPLCFDEGHLYRVLNVLRRQVC